jgi:8-oxo-dGTP pyrophosphatase MutT (NUDIX family)
MITKSALLVFRGEDDKRQMMLVRAGKPWFVLPGGKQEPGESAEAALRRELREELACDATNVCELGTVSGHTPDGRELVMQLYSASLMGDPKPSAEITEIAWMTRREMERRAAEMTPMTLQKILPFMSEHSLW